MLIRLTVLALLTGGVAVASTVDASAVVQDDMKAELEKRKADLAEDDAQAHFDLAIWAQSNGLKTDYKRLLRKVIKIDKDHEEARKLLNYQRYNDKWVTERELERLKRKEEEAKMLEKGMRKWNGEWYPAEEVEKMEQGLFKVEVDGQEQWVTEIAKERIEQGLVLYEGQWIKEEDKQKIDDGLFPFDGQWLTKEQANEAHGELGKHWQIDGDYTLFGSTCNHDFIQKAIIEADQAVSSTYRVLGVAMPEEFPKLDMMLVAKLEDYNNLGNIAQENDDAFMSSNWECFSAPNPETGRVVGVVKYTVLDESNPDGNDRFTLMIVRQAATEAALRAMGLKEEVPRWFTTGVAAYLGRFTDPTNATGWKVLGGWSAGALQREGGMIPADSYFGSFNITRQSVLQSGLMVSYLMHAQGRPADVDEAWGEVQAAMKADDNAGLTKAFAKLEKALATEDGEKSIADYQDHLING